MTETEILENNETAVIAADFNKLISFPTTAHDIAEIKEKYLVLRVTDLTDVVGYAACDAARKRVKGLRIAIEKRRKEIKKESIEWQKRLDSTANGLMTELEAVELHLETQQKIIDDEKKRIEEEEKAKALAKFQARISALQTVKAEFDYDQIRLMDDNRFEEFLLKAVTTYDLEVAEKEAERKRVAELEAQLEAQRIADKKKADEQEAENKKLREQLAESQRRELEEKNRQLEEERARTEAERKRREEAEAQKAKQEREAEEVRLATERAIREAEERRLAEIAAAKQAAEEAEAKRLADIEAERQKAAEEAARLERERKDAEEARLALEAAEKKKAEEEAAKKIWDQQLFEDIKVKFPSVESCWVEIARLIRKIKDLEAQNQRAEL
jgi:hypothetical protein